MGTTPPKTFARDATGLVRQLGFIDQFVISQAGANWLPGVPLVALYAPYFFPGAYLPLTVLIGCIPAFGMAFVYAKLSGMMPRSGGDYVWSSRILGSLYGSIQFAYVFAIFIITALGLAFVFFPTIGLAQLFFATGAVENSASLVGTASNMGAATLGYPLSIGLVLLACIVPLFGLRIYAWVQGVSYFLIYLGVIVLGIALLVLNFSGVPAAFDHAMQVAGSNTTYSGIIQSAPPSALKFNLTNTVLAALPWGFLSFTGFNFGTYLGGETKNARSNFPKALYLSVAVTTLLLTAFLALVVRDFGSTFINGASYVVANGSLALPTLPTVTMLLALINLPAGLFVGIAITLGLIIVTFANTLQLSRLIFAGSFDRLLPDVFSRVSSRYRVPYIAVILVGIISAIYMTIYWKFGFASVFLNSSLVLPIGFILPLIAVLLWPLVKPADFKRITSGFGSYALIGLGALVAIVGFIIYIIAEMVPILSGVFLGSSLTYAYGTVAGVFVVGILLYITAVIRARRSHIDFRQIYSEIPPE